MRTTRKPPAKSLREPAGLPDGLGGTIAGGPARAIDLTALLRRPEAGVEAGLGAGLGAGASGREEPEQNEEFALSDGSRIIFASLRDSRLLTKA